MSNSVERVGLGFAGLLSIAATLIAIQCLGVWSVGFGVGALIPGTFFMIDAVRFEGRP